MIHDPSAEEATSFESFSGISLNFKEQNTRQGNNTVKTSHLYKYIVLKILLNLLAKQAGSDNINTAGADAWDGALASGAAGEVDADLPSEVKARCSSAVMASRTTGTGCCARIGADKENSRTAAGRERE